MIEQKILTDEECCPKYKKKSQAKPPKKSKHKHYYEPCVLEYPSDWFLKEHERSGDKKSVIDGYCPVCGKIGSLDNRERWYTTGKTQVSYFFVSSKVPTEEGAKELNPSTRTIPTFCVSDMFQKFVELEQEND